MFIKFLKYKLQQGQAFVFVAISAPLLFLFVGAAADFGWLYLHQVRLQNAADSAVVAGAQKLLFHDSSLDDYVFSRLITNHDEDFLQLVNSDTISTRDTSDGDKRASDYIRYNLDNGNLKILDISSPPGSAVESTTGKLLYSSNGNSTDPQTTIKFKHMLYGSDENDYQTLYYVVTITQPLEHLLGDIFNYFDFIPNLQSKAVAVAKISHYYMKNDEDPIHGVSLYQQMVELRARKNFADWWEIKYGYDKVSTEERKKKYGTTDTMDIARARSVQAKGNEYTDKDKNGNTITNYYRTETLTLHGWSVASKGNGNVGTTQMNQMDFDSLFIDLKADLADSNLKDQDYGSGQKEYNLKTDNKQIKSDTIFSNGLTGSEVFKFRIHDLINIGKWNGSKYEYVYKTREGKESPDPLFVYIESEDNYVDGTARNTVRQFIINVNADNTGDDDRPMFIFYDGPQKYDNLGKTQKTNSLWQEKWRETWKYLGYYDKNNNNADYVGNLRNSLPVIFNMNANFNGVLFFPNSPVVINGNGYNFEGFVVAERYLRLKTATDFPEVANSTEAKLKGFNLYTDGRGNTYYKNDDNMVYYHAAAEGCRRYIQIVTVLDENNNRAIRYRNVVYLNTTDENEDTILTRATKNPVDNAISSSDNIYINPDGEYFVIPKEAANNVIKNSLGKYEAIDSSKPAIFYTYTWMNEEKSNMLSTYINSEKDYLKISPMYVDQFGNVQYMPLDGDYKYVERPNPTDTEWHSGYTSGNVNYNAIDDKYEIIYKPSYFNIGKATYNSFNRVRLIDYTNLNSNRVKGKDDNYTTVSDIFYTTIRSDWID